MLVIVFLLVRQQFAQWEKRIAEMSFCKHAYHVGLGLEIHFIAASSEHNSWFIGFESIQEWVLQIQNHSIQLTIRFDQFIS